MYVKPRDFPVVPTIIGLIVFAIAILSYQTIGVKLAESQIEGATYGIASLFPTLIVIVLAIVTKRSVESLLTGVLVGVFMVAPLGGAVPEISNIFLKVFTNDVVAWIFGACGLMGSIIALISASGGALAFGQWLSKKVHSRKYTLFSTMFMGLIIFVDDYLNALTIGTSMRTATDNKKVSREMLSYIVDSTAAPVCILLPISTWALFYMGLFKEYELMGEGQTSFELFVETIPYMVYAIVCLLVVVLVIIGIIKPIGKMRQAEERAQTTGKVISDEDKALHIGLGEDVKPGKIHNFFIPMIALIGFTWYFDKDILPGSVAAVIVTAILYFLQKTMGMGEIFDRIIKGFIHMLFTLAVLFSAFMLGEVNSKLGMTDYVINSVLSSGIVNQFNLAAVLFVVIAALAFATASFWGVLVIAMPIVAPLMVELDANIPLILGALFSAIAFGSHACFYGDSTVLSARSCEISPMSHAITQLPYALIGGTVSVIIFLILGYSL